MTRISALVTTMLLALGAVARAQPVDPYSDDGAYDQTEVVPDDAPPGDVAPSANVDIDVNVESAVPPTEMPSDTPPPIASQNVVPDGQWVYTQQYGWVWMPYGDQYVQMPADDYTPAYCYVYYPAQGWVWLDAPWVIGWGARPYFGYYGYSHYHWWPRYWVSSGAWYGGWHRDWGYDRGRGWYRNRTVDHRVGGGGWVAPRGGWDRDHRSGGWTAPRTYAPRTYAPRGGYTAPARSFAPSRGYTPSRTFAPARTFAPSRGYTPSRTFAPTRSYTAPARTFAPSRGYTPSRTFTPTRSFGGGGGGGWHGGGGGGGFHGGGGGFHGGGGGHRR
jgi:uncharacterized membrane protein YgcG